MPSINRQEKNNNENKNYNILVNNHGDNKIPQKNNISPFSPGENQKVLPSKKNQIKINKFKDKIKKRSKTIDFISLGGTVEVTRRKVKSNQFTKTEEIPENYQEIIQETQIFVKSLKEIETSPVYQTPEKQNMKSDSNKLQSPSLDTEKSYKRASKTKDTLKVVMENYKRSPSILFSSPMQNIYFIEVLQNK